MDRRGSFVFSMGCWVPTYRASKKTCFGYSAQGISDFSLGMFYNTNFSIWCWRMLSQASWLFLVNLLPLMSLWPEEVDSKLLFYLRNKIWKIPQSSGTCQGKHAWLSGKKSIFRLPLEKSYQRKAYCLSYYLCFQDHHTRSKIDHSFSIYFGSLCVPWYTFYKTETNPRDKWVLINRPHELALR